MKKLLLAVCLILVSSPAFSRDDIAKFDANRVPATLGITSGGELRMLKTDANGVLLSSPASSGASHVIVDSGTVTANVSNTGFKVLNVTTVTFNGSFQPVYVVSIPTVTFNGESQPIYIVSIPTVTFNGVEQPVFMVNIPTVTFNGISQPVFIDSGTVTFSTIIPGTMSVTNTSASLIFSDPDIKSHFICNESTNAIRMGDSSITADIGLLIPDGGCISINDGAYIFNGSCYAVGTVASGQKISWLIGK